MASFLILLGWEFFEFFYGVYETQENKTLDMIMGMFGFFVVYYLMSNNIFNNKILFSILIVLFVILEIWGFSSYEEVKKDSYIETVWKNIP